MAHQSTNQFTDVAEIYDNLMSVVPYGWWADYVESLWSRFGVNPRRVLDLACGTGNVTRELERRGYEVEGVDLSEAMLKVAARKLRPQTRLWCQDARTLDLETPPFDACVCLFDSLNYLLEPGDLHRAFRAIHRHLTPGGVLVFDMNSIWALQSGMFDQKGTGEDERLEFEWHSAWDPIARLCTIMMEFRVQDQRGYRVFHETHMQRGYSVEDIRGNLEDARFNVLGVYDAFTTRAPGARSDRYHIIACAK